MEREATLQSWQAGLEKREQAADDLRDRSRALQEAERQVSSLNQDSANLLVLVNALSGRLVQRVNVS